MQKIYLSKINLKENVLAFESEWKKDINAANRNEILKNHTFRSIEKKLICHKLHTKLNNNNK